MTSTKSAGPPTSAEAIRLSERLLVLSSPKVVGSNPTPSTMNDEGLADVDAANPFRLLRLHPGNVHPGGSQLAEIGELLKAGRIWPVIDKVSQFEQAKEALGYLEKGRAKGKVVVQMRQWRRCRRRAGSCHRTGRHDRRRLVTTSACDRADESPPYYSETAPPRPPAKARSVRRTVNRSG